MELSIGALRLANPLVLAPMTSFTDHPFREICASMGAGLLVTEMLSAEGLVRAKKPGRDLLPPSKRHGPVAVQLFGGFPNLLAEAARICQEEGADLVDLNMGCPVPKVVRRGAGAALLKDLPLAARILRAMRKKLSIPLTVKIRSGWTSQENVVLEMRRIAWDCGVDAMTLHPRARSETYAQPARWELLRALAENSPIPVIGNGDVRIAQDALHMLKATGCQGVMIGRGAIGNPWIFRQALGLLASEPCLPGPDSEEIWRVLKMHLEKILEHYGPQRALAPAKLHASKYIRGLEGSAFVRWRLSGSRELGELEQILEGFLTQKHHGRGGISEGFNLA
ncbi:MAG: tRNA dihydrouridine synthase DusB [bacterium]